MLKYPSYNASTFYILRCPSCVLNLQSRGWVSALLCLDCKWCNVRNLFADKNSNFIPWFWLQSQWQWGWGESGVSSLYLPPNYGHNNVHQALLSQPIRWRFYWPMTRLEEYTRWMRGLYRKSRFHEMLFDELWSSNWWHLGSTLRKETRAQSLQSQSWAEPEMGNFKRILLSHWMKHLVQKYT